jgi:hypothetical protein
MVHSNGPGVPLYENIIEVSQHFVDHIARCVCALEECFIFQCIINFDQIQVELACEKVFVDGD